MAEKKTYEPLDELLDSSGMKYKVIAKKINVPYTTFYKWRINPSRIDAVSAANIAEVIGVDLTDVIFVLKNFNQKLDKLASQKGFKNESINYNHTKRKQRSSSKRS